MRAEAVSNRGPSAYQPNALPLGQTGSLALPTPLSSLYLARTTKFINEYSVHVQGVLDGVENMHIDNVGFGDRSVGDTDYHKIT